MNFVVLILPTSIVGPIESLVLLLKFIAKIGDSSIGIRDSKNVGFESRMVTLNLLVLGRILFRDADGAGTRTG